MLWKKVLKTERSVRWRKWGLSIEFCKETDDHEKAYLEKELNKIEVTKYAMAFSNPNKSPGEDEIIGWFCSTLLGLIKKWIHPTVERNFHWKYLMWISM